MKKLTSYSLILAAVFFTALKTSAQNANTSLSNLAAHIAVNHSLTPHSSNSVNLGSGAAGWLNLYLTGGLYLDGHKFLSNQGSFNNFIGTDAGQAISSGIYNTGVGYNALFNNASGTQNTALGYNALYSNGSGGSNTALGESALVDNLSGYYNTATGKDAMHYNTTGSYNSATGFYALGHNTTGSYNTATGFGSLDVSGAGDYNTATGYLALDNNGNSYNTAHGAFALTSNTSGYNNTANGVSALYHNTSGIDNTAAGLNAMVANTTGSYNIAIGAGALSGTTASQGNTALGYNAGGGYDLGYYNVFVGANTNTNGNDYYNDIAIGQGTICTDVSQVTIGNSATTAYRAYANWSNISDGRFKKNIQENVPGLAFINKLQPITYTLDATGLDNFLHKDQAQAKQLAGQSTAAMSKALTAKEKTFYTGFIAQDVEKAAKSLNFDFSGVDAAKNDKDLYGLRYAEFVVPLVKAVQQLSKMNDAKDSVMQIQNIRIDDLQNQINQLKAMIVSNPPTVTSSSSLQQNVPNPFGSSTTISYTLPDAYTSAEIIITDAKGAVLKQFNLNAKGKGNILINDAALASGAYQYSLYINNKLVDTKKMLLAK